MLISCSKVRRSQRESLGFTFVELVLVIALFGVVILLLGRGTGTFAYWREEGFVRKFSELLTFLHHQAIADQKLYRLEIDMTDEREHKYRVGVADTNPTLSSGLSSVSQSAGFLTLELAAFLNPDLSAGAIRPPDSMPSLAEIQTLPPGVFFDDVRNMRNKYTSAQRVKTGVSFSPRGFSEFSVFHLRLSRGASVTIVVNPFTGTNDIYREYRDFQWTYGQNKK